RRESGPDLADVHETVPLVDPGEKGADAEPRALGIRVAADDYLLPLHALGLHPVGAARAPIGRVTSLRHRALQPEPTRLGEELGPRADHVVAVPQHAGLLAAGTEEPRQRRLSVLQARAGQILPVQVQQIED